MLESIRASVASAAAVVWAVFGGGPKAAASSSPQVLAIPPPRPRPRGGAGTLISAGSIDDTDENADVRNERWYGSPGVAGWAQKMERDAHVRQSLSARSAPLRGALWDFEAASEAPADVEAAAFARWAFFERLSWDRFMRDALRFHRDGFSLFELTDDTAAIPTDRFPLHPGRGTGVVYTGLHHRPAWTVYRWAQSTSDPTQLASVEQRLQGTDGEKPGFVSIPGGALLRFTQEQEGANFAGFSTARSAYGPWKIKRLLLVLDAIRHERMGVATPELTLPEGVEANDEEVIAARSILAEMRSNEKGYILLPHGYEFKWASGGESTNIGEAIERCNRDIAFNTGTGFMLLGLTGGTGSYALAQSQDGQYQVSLEGDAKFVCDTINLGSDGWSPVERLIRLNYGAKVGLPRICVRNMPTRNWEKLLPVVKDLVGAKIITVDNRLEDFTRKVTYLPARDPATARKAIEPPPMVPGQAPAPAKDEPPAPAEDKPAEPMKEAA
ncbi:MAG: hypothetical protein RL139_904 [Gemmatimonadota bacterium]